MLDNSLMCYPSAMMHLEAQELQHPLFSLEFESLIESESKSVDTQLIPRILLAQPDPSSLMRAPSMSFEHDCRSQAVTRSQFFSVRSVRAKNFEIIRAALRRCSVKCDDGCDPRALD